MADTKNDWGRIFSDGDAADRPSSDLVTDAYYLATDTGQLSQWDGSSWDDVYDFGADADVFAVEDYGAIGNGTTDDTAAIQAAIDAANSAGGGTVLLGPHTYLVSYVAGTAGRHALAMKANVVLVGAGMFASTIELDTGSTVSTSTKGQPIIEIGSATAGASNITLRDFGVLVHHSTKGNDSNKFLQGIAAQHDTTGTAHSDDVTIERVRVVDSNVGIVCGKGALTPSSSNRFEQWAVRDCVVETTTNKAIEFDQAEDSEMVGNVVIDAQDGLQFLNYTARSVMYGNRVQYKDGGINLSEGISDCDISGNVAKAIAGGGVGFNGGLVIRRESYASTGPTSSRVKVHHNIFDDSASDASAHKIGVQFATYAGNTGVATFEDYELYANTFIADINYIQDAWFPAKSQAVRLRVFDNHFTDEVMTHADWVSAGTRFSRNTVEGDFTVNSDDWDLRGFNVIGGTFTDNGSGTITDPSGGADAAADVSFDPTGLDVISGTDVQTALEELDAAIDTLVSGSVTVATDTIWDAAGDLAVGTGANTAAKLSLGTTGRVLGSNGSSVAYLVAPKAHWCRVTDGNAQTLSNDTDTVLTSDDAEVADPDGWHDTGSNTSRITPNIAGLYSLTGEVFFTAHATGLRNLQLWKNGSTQIGLTRIPVNSGSDATEIQVHCHTVLNGSTDYVEVRARQTTGGNLNVFLSLFEAVLIGTTP